MSHDGPDQFAVDLRSSGSQEDRATARSRVMTAVVALPPGASEVVLSPDFAQATLDALPAHVVLLGAAGEILMTNRAWREFAAANDGRDAAATCSPNYLAVCDAAAPDPFAQRAGRGLRAIMVGAQQTFSLEYPCHTPTTERWFHMRASRLDAVGPARVVVCHDDVTGRRQAVAQVATQAALLDEVGVAVIATDLDGRITQWNRGAERLHGWSLEEVRGLDAAQLLSPPATPDGTAGPLFGDGRWECEVAARRKDGTTFRAFVHGGVTLDRDGNAAGRVGVFADVTQRVTADRALSTARDHLRAVTDSMGEGLFTLDADGCITYMNEVAERLLGWTLAELQGRPVQGLAPVLDGTVGPQPLGAMLRAQRAREVARVPDGVFLRRDGVEMPVSYTAAPLATADGAHGVVVVFSDATQRKAREAALVADADKLTWIGRINEALTEDRFVLHGQPIVDLSTGAVAQRELLVRMTEADGTIIAPGAFLPTAEEYRLIGGIDRWVVRQGLRLAMSDGGPVQINLSAQSVGDDVVLAHIEECLQQTGVDPALVVFEITETALIQDEAAARIFAERLHDLGCGLALDDFGTGYGGFTYLKRFPMDMVKIDSEFVRDAVVNEASRHVIRAVVALAESFRLVTVAEGIEDAPTLDLVRGLGVHLGQGYHIARPGPIGTAPSGPPPQGRQDRSTS